MNSKMLQLVCGILLLCVTASVEASDLGPGWLATRNQNPFALDIGLPLAPAVPASGTWLVDASVTISNTELGQSRDDTRVLFDLESRETRLSLAYAWNDEWSARISLSQLRASAGFLDGPVERFHRIFGFDNGDRGQLDTVAPFVALNRGTQQTVLLDRPETSIGPLQLDLNRQWQTDTFGRIVLSLGASIPVSGGVFIEESSDVDVSLAVSTLKPIGDRWLLGARLGVLARGDNERFAAKTHSMVSFASLLVRYRLGSRWSAVVQSDAHDALYHDLPALPGSAGNQLSFGLIRRLGQNGELIATLGEDVPALHSADVAVHLGLRMQLGH